MHTTLKERPRLLTLIVMISVNIPADILLITVQKEYVVQQYKCVWGGGINSFFIRSTNDYF